MTATFTERLVTRLASVGRRRTATSRRGFLAAATLTGAALAVDPIGYLLKPQSAYASVCGTDASCSSGYTVFCCTINKGSNTCPPGTFAGGWWKADHSSYCGGAARYYIDCNAKPGHHFTCHCNQTTCDHRFVACNIFRYGQCNTDVHGVTAVVCRQISCRPPWELFPNECGHTSATDNNTAGHTAPCLTKANTFPALKVYAKGPSSLVAGHRLAPGSRLTSADRHTTCIMTKAGRLDIFTDKGRVWHVPSSGAVAGSSAVLRASGALEVVTTSGHVAWTSGTSTSAHHVELHLRDNGELVIVAGSTVIWRSHTHTP